MLMVIMNGATLPGLFSKLQ